MSKLVLANEAEPDSHLPRPPTAETHRDEPERALSLLQNLALWARSVLALAPAVRSEAQVAVGLILLLLPALVRGPLWYPQCCLSPIWFLIAKLLVMRDATVGSHLRLALQMAAGLAIGVIWGGAVVSFVKAVTTVGSHAQLALACVLGTLGAMPIAAGRAAQPDGVWLLGLTSAVMYGTTIILGLPDLSVGDVWSKLVCWLLLTIALSSAVLALVGILVLPTTSAVELTHGAARVMAASGLALERCMALLCVPPEMEVDVHSGTHDGHAHTPTDKGHMDDGHAHSIRAHYAGNGTDSTHHHQPSAAAEAGHPAAGPLGEGLEDHLGHGAKPHAPARPPVLLAEHSLAASGLNDMGPHALRQQHSMSHLSEVHSVVLHDELDAETDYQAWMLDATKPTPNATELALFKLLPGITGAHLLPAGQALQLRRERDGVQKLLLPAAAEPPLMHALESGWALLSSKLGLTSGAGTVRDKPAKHKGDAEAPVQDETDGSGRAWWRMRFSVPAWQKALSTLACVLDSLAALEAVARDLVELTPSHTHPHPHPHSDSHPHPHGHSQGHLHPHSLHGSHSSSLHPHPHSHIQLHSHSAHPHPHPHVRVHSHLHPATASHQPQHPTVFEPAASAAPAEPQSQSQSFPGASAATATQLPSATGSGPSADSSEPSLLAAPAPALHSRPSHKRATSWHKSTSWLRSGSGRRKVPRTASELPAVWRLWYLAEGAQPAGYEPLTLRPSPLHDAVRHALHDAATQAKALSGLAAAWPMPMNAGGLKVSMPGGADDKLMGTPARSMAWHKQSLSAAMIQRTRKYWAATLKGLAQAGEEHKPLRMLKADKLRAQYFISLATLQVVTQLDELNQQLQAAYNPLNASAPPAASAVVWLAGWLGELLPLAIGLDLFKHWKGVATDGWSAVRKGKAGVKAVLLNQRVQSGIKYWLMLSVMMVVVLVMIAFAPKSILISPPIFAYITAAAVMRPQVETTFNQAILRVVATALGCLLGWGLLSSPTSAGSPVLVGAVVVIAITCLSPIARTQFKLMAYVSATTITAVTMCQLGGVGCCQEGYTGSWQYTLERFISVCAGVLVPVFFNHLVFPWYLSLWSLSRLGDSYATATALLEHQYNTLVQQHTAPKGPGPATDAPGAAKNDDLKSKHAPVPTAGESVSTPGMVVITVTEDLPGAASPNETAVASVLEARSSAGADDPSTDSDPVPAQPPALPTPAPPVVTVQTKVLSGPAVPAPPAPTLAAVQAPLSEVIAALARDATLWQRGLMATPHAVHALMAAITLMADRLAALQVTLQGVGSFSPCFSSWSSIYLSKPLEPEVRKVLSGIDRLTASTGELLAGWDHPDSRARLAAQLAQQVEVVVTLRFQAHMWHVKLRQALHVKVLGLALAAGWSPHSGVAGRPGSWAHSHSGKHYGHVSGVHGAEHSAPNLGTHPTEHSAAGPVSHADVASHAGVAAHAANASPTDARLIDSAVISAMPGDPTHPHSTAVADDLPPTVSASTAAPASSVPLYPSGAHAREAEPPGGAAANGTRSESPFLHAASSAAGFGWLQPVGSTAGPVAASAAFEKPGSLYTDGGTAGTAPIAGEGGTEPVGQLSPPHPQPQPNPSSGSSSGGSGGATTGGTVSLVHGVTPSTTPDVGSEAHMIGSLFEEGRSLSALLPVDEFHPSDTVGWLACMYALTHALDAAIHVARVAVAASRVAPSQTH